MRVGFLPPSSSESFLNIGAAVAAMRAPVVVPPVKLMALIPGWVTMASPTLGPVPWTMFSTPGGNPASMQISPNRQAVYGVISDGLATTVLPAASAGAIFQENK